MVANVPRDTWGKLGSRSTQPRPQSRRAIAASANSVAFVDPEGAADPSPVAPQHKGKLPSYTVLYPVTVVVDFASVEIAFNNGQPFYVGRMPKLDKPEETEVADRHNFNQGDMVILAYGRNYSLQRWHRVT